MTTRRFAHVLLSLAASSLLATGSPDAVSAATARTVESAEGCGYWTSSTTAFYKHCGRGYVQVDVETWYGAGPSHSFCFSPGNYDLSARVEEFVTNAYYVSPC